MAKQEEKRKVIATNRRAYHEYEVIERYEAGIVLTGTEVRSLRENGCQLRDCYALIRNNECWLYNLHIAPYSHGGYSNVDPDRRRKLLLHRRQIRLLEQKTQERGFALVPLSIYFNDASCVKVELALGRGKKLYDKRQDIAKKDAQRDIERALKERSR